MKDSIGLARPPPWPPSQRLQPPPPQPQLLPWPGHRHQTDFVRLLWPQREEHRGWHLAPPWRVALEIGLLEPAPEPVEPGSGPALPGMDGDRFRTALRPCEPPTLRDSSGGSNNPRRVIGS